MWTFTPYEPPTQEGIERPTCELCGTKMWLARIHPHETPCHEVRTFECPECEHSQRDVVKFR
jgi:hypothetical protein